MSACFNVHQWMFHDAINCHHLQYWICYYLSRELPYVLSWILQIIYSELLGVPSSTETGTHDTYNNFYDSQLRMDYGSVNDIDVVTNAYEAEGGDCTVYKDSKDGGQTVYTPCAHFAMDIWNLDTWSTIVQSGAAEPMKCEYNYVDFLLQQMKMSEEHSSYLLF